MKYPDNEESLVAIRAGKSGLISGQLKCDENPHFTDPDLPGRRRAPGESGKWKTNSVTHDSDKGFFPFF